MPVAVQMSMLEANLLCSGCSILAVVAISVEAPLAAPKLVHGLPSLLAPSARKAQNFELKLFAHPLRRLQRTHLPLVLGALEAQSLMWLEPMAAPPAVGWCFPKCHHQLAVGCFALPAFGSAQQHQLLSLSGVFGVLSSSLKVAAFRTPKLPPSDSPRRHVVSPAVPPARLREFSLQLADAQIRLQWSPYCLLRHGAR
jgi:hypothetical protein